MQAMSTYEAGLQLRRCGRASLRLQSVSSGELGTRRIRLTWCSRIDLLENQMGSVNRKLEDISSLLTALVRQNDATDHRAGACESHIVIGS